MFDFEKHGRKILKKSMFGHFFDSGNFICAYNSLKIITIYFEEDINKYLQMTLVKPVNDVFGIIPDQLKKGFISRLTEICNASIFVPFEYDEVGYLHKIQDTIFTPPSPRVLVLHLTDYCNLQCRYCFIEGNIKNGYQRRNMTHEVMEKSIDKFGQIISDKNFTQKPSIVFYGGEPLMNWRTMKYGLQYLHDKQERGEMSNEIDKVIITNGTLITDEIVDELKKYNVLPAVSIDGYQSIHDLNRVYKNGEGTFTDALKGFNKLRGAGLKPTVASVLSKDAVNDAENIIHWLLGDLGVKALGFNHVSIIPTLNFYDPEYEEAFADAVLKIQDIIQESYPDVYERRMNRKFNCFLKREILRADCTGCGEQMSVSPDGWIGICQGYMGSRKTFNNSVLCDEFMPESDDVFIEWSRRSPLSMEECFSCSALSTCGGGCPRNADFIHGSIWRVDSAFCHFAKKAQEWMIWKKFQKMKEVS